MKYCSEEAQNRLNRANGIDSAGNNTPPIQDLETSVENMNIYSQGVHPSIVSPPPPMPSEESQPDGVYAGTTCDIPALKTLNDVNASLMDHYRNQVVIRRVNGEQLGIESCHVNLAIIESSRQRRQGDDPSLEQPNVSTPKTFLRLPSYEQIAATNTEKLVQLSEIFDKRQLLNGTESIPKRILIMGQAGIGKTTLCKKLIYSFQSDQWSGRFGAILWLPLCQLQAYKSRNLKDLLLEVYFIGGSQSAREGLANQFIRSAESGQVLFILDGLDEILIEALSDGPLQELLTTLLNQTHVIITSRPYGADRSLLQDLDLELEAVGLNTENVDQYVKSYISSDDDMKKILDFIRQSPAILGLVNIPVQLDLICNNWNDLASTEKSTTITQLYQTIVRKLWCNDAVRRRVDIKNLLPKDIDIKMSALVEFLGYLAFRGLKHNNDASFDQNTISLVGQELNQHRRQTGQSELSPSFLEEVKKSSLLYQTDTTTNSNAGGATWNFIHLKFQEYFAATWLSKYFQTEPSRSSGKSNLMDKDGTISFIRLNKYNPRFEILWWLVAGQLEGGALESYFHLLQSAPRDLIGPRHQLLLAGCFMESQSKLSAELTLQIENDMIRWIRFETAYKDEQADGSLFFRHLVFPEHILFRAIAGCEETQKHVIASLKYRKYLAPATVDLLIENINDKNVVIQRLSIEAIGGQQVLTDNLSTFLVDILLQSDDHEVIAAAAVALRNQSTLPGSTISTLLSALYHGDIGAKYSVAAVLCRQSGLSEPITLSLVNALHGEDEDLREYAYSILRIQSKLSESTIAALVSISQQGRPDVRALALQLFLDKPELPESVIGTLVESLGDGDLNIRYYASVSLGKQSKFSEPITTTLVGGLQHENTTIRCGVARALASYAISSESTRMALVAALEDDDWSVRASAAKSLGKNPMLPASIISLLVMALNDETYIDSTVQNRVAKIFQGMIIVNQSAAATLVTSLQDGYSEIKSAVAEALANQSSLSESTMAVLATAIRDKSAYTREVVVLGLTKQSTLPEYITNTLVTLLQENDSSMRYLAIKGLSNQLELFESTTKALVELLAQNDVLEDKDIRTAAANILGNYSNLPEYATSALVLALQDEFEEVEVAAAKALCNQSKFQESWVVALANALKFEKALGEPIQSILGNHKVYQKFGDLD
ncbi:hypothetical protein BGZ76_009978, partial [Entomortierella beljakovae]